MGLFDFLESVPIIGDAYKGAKSVVNTVGNIGKGVVNTVGGFAKPLWGIAKKTVGSFVPGGEQMLDMAEGIGGGLLNMIGSEAGGAKEQLADMGEAIMDTNLRNYGQTRDELMGGYDDMMERGRRIKNAVGSSGKKLMEGGRQFLSTLKNKQAWADMYGGEEDEEDNNYRLQRAKARAAKRRRRQQVEELD